MFCFCYWSAIKNKRNLKVSRSICFFPSTYLKTFAAFFFALSVGKRRIQSPPSFPLLTQGRLCTRNTAYVLAVGSHEKPFCFLQTAAATLLTGFFPGPFSSFLLEARPQSPFLTPKKGSPPLPSLLCDTPRL